MSENVKGLNMFKKYFEDYIDNYIIVGGTACYLTMKDANLDFRSTKDIDIIIIVESLSKQFGIAFWKFIKEGGYENYQKNDESKFYRFLKPKDDNFPSMIELFSRKQEIFTKNIESIFIPIKIDEDISSLSAILLDNDYYSFLKNGKTIIDGLSTLQPIYLIAFKAKAFVDLFNKKKSGQFVKETDIKKHKYDVFRLSQLLTGEEEIDITENIKKDIQDFFELLGDEKINLRQLNINVTQELAIKTIKEIFHI